MNVKWFGSLAVAAIGMAAAVSSPAQTWRQVGPPGGTVISLEADSHNIKKIYLGTSDGHVFFSNDEGAHWQLISRIGTGQDDVITHILVDPRDANRLYASTWTLYSGGGGVYRSDDAGHSWRVIGLAHETVRALAQAPTNPKTLVAGSLTGVYRSTDDGATWTLISPPKHEDLRNFDSVAFDPRDENTIYAGTYHLPWKTTNGGKDWFPIKAGMIDDSDVMSIVIDPANPENVHATACSGIYHSVNAAQTWTKYKGIPFRIPQNAADSPGSAKSASALCGNYQRLMEDHQRERLEARYARRLGHQCYRHRSESFRSFDYRHRTSRRTNQRKRRRNLYFFERRIPTPTHS